MKKYCWLVIFLTVILLTVPASGLAQGGNAAIFYEEDNVVGSFASYQGKLYILKYDGLSVLDPATMKQTLVTDSLSCYWDTDQTYTDMLLADVQGLYGMRMEQRRIFRIMEGGTLVENQEALQLRGEGSLDSVFIQNGILYLLESDGTQTWLRTVDLATGSESAMELPKVNKMTSSREGFAIAVEERRVNGRPIRSLSEMNLRTGELSQLAELDVPVHAVAYDSYQQRVYLAGSGRLYTWRQETGVTLAAHTLGGDTAAVTPFSETCAAVMVDNSIVIRDTEGQTEQRSLVLRQPNGRSEEYKAFLTEHPDVSLIFSGDHTMTAEEQFVQDMAIRSDEFDLYLLSDPNLLATIDAKGYCLDLSADEAITATVESMYPPFRDLFRRQNSIVAIPQSVYITMLGYDEAFFQRFDLTVPTTIDDLLTLAQVWLDEYVYENDEALFNPFRNGIDLISILKRYADECTGNGKATTYATPEMEALLQKYLATVNAYQESRMAGHYELHAMNVIDVPHIGVYQYMPLSVMNGNEPVISGTDVELQYFVVNPFSKQPEIALSFLESAINNWPPMLELLLLPSAAHAVERVDYAEEKENLQREMDARIDLLNARDVPDTSDIRQRMEEKQTQLAHCDESRWIITQEEVDWYRSVVDRIVFSNLNPISILQEKQTELFTQFLNGGMDAKRFVEVIDEKVRSVYLEYQ